MAEKKTEEQYEMAFRQAGYAQPFFANNARRQMAQMVETIAKGNEHIDAILSTAQTNNVKGGFIAEEYHAETYNMDAILKGDDARAYTDRYSEWNNLEWQGNPLRKNDVPDIVVARDGKVSSSVQSKYYDSAENTAAQMSQTKDGKVKYGDVDALLGPEDQVTTHYQKVPGEAEPVATTTIKEHAQAKAEAMQAKNGNKSQIDAYEQTAKKATDKVQDGEATSRALSKEDADKLGSGDKSAIEQVENEYQTKSTIQQMAKAGVGSAAITAVVSGSRSAIRYIQMANNGEITNEEATRKIVYETVGAAADSTVKAAANAGAQSLLIRYGSEEAAMQALAKQGLQSMVKTNALTIGVTCTIDLIKDLVCLGTGTITTNEFYDRQGKGILMTTSGVGGGSAGAAGAAWVASSLGASAGTLAMTAAEIIGGLTGGIIAGLAMKIAIENGIEKPYWELVQTTTNLCETAKKLNDVSGNMVKGHKLTGLALQAEHALDEQFSSHMQHIFIGSENIHRVKEKLGKSHDNCDEALNLCERSLREVSEIRQQAEHLQQKAEMVERKMADTGKLAWDAIKSL